MARPYPPELPEMTRQQRRWVADNQHVARAEAAKKTIMGRRVGLDFDELLAAANWGLVLASYKFEPRRGLKFATLGSHYARREVYMAIRKAIRLRYPIRGSEVAVCSLDALHESLGGHADICVAPEEEPRADDDDMEALMGALGKIDDIDARVIKMRAEGLTFREIGERIGMSHERSRYFANRAIDHLCHHLDVRRPPFRRYKARNFRGSRAKGDWSRSLLDRPSSDQ